MNFVFNQSGDGNTQIGSIGRGPEWVRTVDRLPDGDEFQMLIVYAVDEIFIGPRYVWEVKANPDKYQYYIPMPQLPEVEG
jgi:hypothetical protein